MHTLNPSLLQPHSVMESWLVLLISQPASLQCCHSLSLIAEVRPHSQLQIAADYLDTCAHSPLLLSSGLIVN